MTVGNTGASSAQDKVRIRYAGYNHPTEYVGMTVKQARDKLSPMWGVPTDAVAYKGKEQLSDSTFLQAGDEIQFVKRQGEKGE